jgi:Asp-tRNA(Asn)/Glu-tRNA(Gln) amidotransferase A subunit family amidase
VRLRLRVPSLVGPVAATCVLRTLPQAANLKELYKGTRHDGLGPEIKRRILMGTYALSAGFYDAYYKRAQQVLLHTCAWHNTSVRRQMQRPHVLLHNENNSSGHRSIAQFDLRRRRSLRVVRYCRTVRYWRAYLQVRTVVREAMEGAVGRYDALLSAVAPSAAYKFGEKLDDPLAMYKGDLMTVGLNLSGAF